MPRFLSFLKLSASVALICSFGGWPAEGWAAGYGFDAGQSLESYSRLLSEGKLTGKNGGWVRMRGLAGSGGEGGGPVERQAADREALRVLHAQGVNVCVILRWGSEEWRGGVRAGNGHRLPLDLREAFERGRRLGAAYGDLVDAWEIENEPDIGFVAENPEVMAAFHKACYLGLKAGARNALQASNHERRTGSLASPWLAQKFGRGEGRSSQPPKHNSSRVLMPPLALPPGPYFERLWGNGLASYSDGFNYHFYGYAEDFSGVYRQFEDAVRHSQGSKLGPPKTLPVFLTEYGYGLMDGVARHTVEGRVRQWRWFADVAGQLRMLRPEGPMTFVLNPYFERELAEFGLLMERASHAGEPLKTKDSEPRADRSMNTADRPPLVFAPSDFGARSLQPWMQRIGAPQGSAHASPALAYLQDYAARHPYAPRNWKVRASAPSPIVIDFIAGDDMSQHKDYGGYWLKGSVSDSSEAEREESSAGTWELMTDRTKTAVFLRTGHGRVVLYNFSDRTAEGSLAFSLPGRARVQGAGATFTLAPGERRELPVALEVAETAFSENPLRLVFTPASTEEAPSVYSTLLYPAGDNMTRRRVADFNFTTEEGAAARVALLARPLAGEEPPLHPDGRWLVSDGVKVTEEGGVWRFDVSHFPSQPLRPAVVELPLPADFVFARDTMLLFKHRKGAAAPEIVGPLEDSRYRTRAGSSSDLFDVYVRTANGNLYQGSPRLRPVETWSVYGQCAQNFTMAFFGRAALPWRFADNRPVSLVFFLRPAKLPFAFEVKQAEIVRFETVRQRHSKN